MWHQSQVSSVAGETFFEKSMACHMHVSKKLKILLGLSQNDFTSNINMLWPSVIETCRKKWTCALKYEKKQKKTTNMCFEYENKNKNKAADGVIHEPGLFYMWFKSTQFRGFLVCQLGVSISKGVLGKGMQLLICIIEHTFSPERYF